MVQLLPTETIEAILTKQTKPSKWTMEQRSDILRMFNENISMLVISLKYGCSRNVIAGIIHRERSKPEPAIKIKPAKIKYKKTVSEAVRARHCVTKVPSPRIITAKAPPVKKRVRLKLIEDPKMVTFLELKQNQCKWPFGDPRQSDFRFCGCDAVPSKPYCDAHTATAGRLYGLEAPRSGRR